MPKAKTLEKTPLELLVELENHHQSSEVIISQLKGIFERQSKRLAWPKNLDDRLMKLEEKLTSSRH